VQYSPSIESLPDSVGQVKRVPLRITVVQKRAEKEYSWLGMLPLEGECTNVVEGTHP